ncbi:MAG: hypothetical protein JXA21_25150 [Anaerolineae bacterium]|nr:hypothetical protein [Anaerolineae bacterium]
MEKFVNCVGAAGPFGGVADGGSHAARHGFDAVAEPVSEQAPSYTKLALVAPLTAVRRFSASWATHPRECGQQ